MAKSVPRVRVPAAAKPGDVIEIKTLISHDMETGQRKDSEGNLVPRRIINKFEASVDGKVVFSAEWHPSVSANPYQSFFLRVNETKKIDFAWTDDDGSVYKTSATVNVA